MVPVPATYLWAAVVGAGLGGLAHLVLGWPWWLVAAGFVAAVGVFFLSTAFWGPGKPGGEPFVNELLRVVSPGRARERDRRQEVERFRAAPFPLHGLPSSWSGLRYLASSAGGWSKGQRPVSTVLGLGHGDPWADEGPQLRVEVSIKRISSPGNRRGLAEELWWEATAKTDGDAESWDRMTAIRMRPDPVWSKVTIPVDGEPVTFERLAEGRHWVAQAKLEDRTLILRARDLPVESVVLVRITDLEPYVAGKRRVEETWTRHYDENC